MILTVDMLYGGLDLLVADAVREVGVVPDVVKITADAAQPLCNPDVKVPRWARKKGLDQILIAVDFEVDGYGVYCAIAGHEFVVRWQP